MTQLAPLGPGELKVREQFLYVLAGDLRFPDGASRPECNLAGIVLNAIDAYDQGRLDEYPSEVHPPGRQTLRYYDVASAPNWPAGARETELILNFKRADPDAHNPYYRDPFDNGRLLQADLQVTLGGNRQSVVTVRDEIIHPPSRLIASVKWANSTRQLEDLQSGHGRGIARAIVVTALESLFQSLPTGTDETERLTLY